jgi:putative tricarboxylic transport membrane protein
MMILIAVCALIMRLLGYPMAPLLLGFILGGLMEDNLRRSLTIYDGSMRFLWERPLTLAIMTLTVLIFLAPFIGPAIKGFFRKSASRSSQ